MTKKLGAEFLGTFWLVLGGCGSAVLAAAFPDVGIGLLGVSLAFGLTVMTMAVAVGHISGCNRISGWFEVRRDQVVFGNLATTRMACPNTAVEQELLSAISRKTLQYIIDDGRLVLTDDTGIVLTFGITD